MKKLLCLLAIAFPAPLGIEVCSSHASDNGPWQVLGASPVQQSKKRATVTGKGKTRFLAENAARKAARKVSGGSYTTIRKKTTLKEMIYTCEMVIEYTEKPPEPKRAAPALAGPGAIAGSPARGLPALPDPGQGSVARDGQSTFAERFAFDQRRIWTRA